jgi:hypothetical protein
MVMKPFYSVLVSFLTWGEQEYMEKNLGWFLILWLPDLPRYIPYGREVHPVPENEFSWFSNLIN